MNDSFDMTMADVYARALMTERLVCVVIAKDFAGCSADEVREKLGPLIAQARDADVEGASPAALAAIRARLEVAATRVVERIGEMAESVTGGSSPPG